MLGSLLALALVGGPPAADGLPTVHGVRNPDVTQENLASTICNAAKDKHGFTWVHRQRPNTAYTNKIKFALMDAAGIPRSKAALYELDHDWSIEDGGSPNDPNNLWLQPYFGPRDAHLKDHVENLVHKLICSGQITLEQGGAMLTGNWVATYQQRIGPLP